MRGRVVLYGDRICRNGVRLMRKRREDLAAMVVQAGADPEDLAGLGKAALVAVILGNGQIETQEVAGDGEQ